MVKTQLFTLIISVTALAVSVTTLASSQTTMSHTTREDVTHDNVMDETMSESMIKATMPGQEAFGTIQEIIGILRADPKTDWSNADLEALRQHLIDMNELTMNTQLITKEIPGGIHVTATGEAPRTTAAIQRMVLTHDRMTLQSIQEWDTTVTKRDDGIDISITAQDSQETTKLRGLGFIGIMATGADHPTHHLMMARGDMHSITE